MHIMSQTSDLIKQYRQQGYKDDQIVQAFQQQGMNSQQIYQAFQEADQMQPPAGPVEGMEDEKDDNEAMVERIVEEKWKEFQTKLKDIQAAQKKNEERIAKVEAAYAAVKENFDKLHEGVLGKISEYDTNIKDVGSSVKAMDQVFKKILPTLTDSVNKLHTMSGGKEAVQETKPTKKKTAARKPTIDQSVLDMLKK